MRRLLIALVFAAVTVAFAAGPASARNLDHGGTVFFHNYTVEQGQVIDGNLTVIFGSVENAGRITGDVNTIGGNYTEDPGAELDGQWHMLGPDSLASIAPWVAVPGFARVHDSDHRLFVKLGSSIVVVLVFLLFPVRMRLALDRVERHPGIAAAVGTVAFVSVVPIAVMLLLSIVGIPLIAIEVAALFGGVWLGQGAVALLVGRRLYEAMLPTRTPSPLGALVLGLVVVSAAEILPLVGWAVTAIIWVVGLGCAILAFVRDTSFRGWTPNARSPIGGPPMRGSA